ncbi:aldehyde dehydrogenase family protein [Salinicoccus sp. ID82-1]|uniref:aldehyde dehydrogenase family protein n=1 Tax=Salinicoccus sp. ID82-1 TaxID=2820269 RepID=UPI001F3A78F2|nr:aldehyde dehydrogenase family protein [Salinicoccus sp. ID82-1]MCG1009736.1 aldehyde dehydrogenase family protein [Salinicoccus sp. ID82-1]
METKNWIDGSWSTPSNSQVEVYNPSDLNEKVGTVNQGTAEDVFQAERAAKAAQGEWARKTGVKRAEVLYSMASALEENLVELAELGSREMGKPIGEMKGEVTRGIHLLRYYAGEGVRSDGQLIPSSDVDVLQYSKKVPVGLIGLITPWNFPVAIPVWKLAPALICGNAVIWKPAENASLTATRMVELFEEAGLDKGVLNLVIGKGSVVGKAMLEEADLDGVSFTGSENTGLYVAETCAKRNIKFQTEMGGKNAAVIMKDANLDKTIPIVLSGAFKSAGQKCTATSRIIVESDIYDEVIERLQKGVEEITLSNALDADAYLGPVASKEQYDKVSSYIELARNEAKIIAEKEVSIDKDGYYISPIVITDAPSDHALVKEEIFGPVATVQKAKDFDEAIEMANDTIYGLSAAIFTENLANAHKFLDQTEAGMVRVNQETAGVEYQSPFGGMKQSSSHTREQGQAALEFYTHTKTCAIKFFG